MRKDQRGMIALETLIAFVAFMLFAAFMATWVNAASMQLRFHQALTRTANEVSFYTYALYMVGVTGALRDLNQNELATELRGNVEGGVTALGEAFDILGQLQEIPTAARSASDMNELLAVAESAENLAGDLVNTVNIEGSLEVVERWLDEPTELFQGLGFLALQIGSQNALDMFMSHIVAPAFFWDNLGLNRDQRRAREYRLANITASDIEFGWRDISWANLREQGLDVLTPEGSGFLSNTDADEIVVMARYQIDLGSFFNPLIIFPNLYVTQTAKTRAWVGDGTSFDSSVSAPAERSVAW